jgi:hypothetical protein
MENEKPDSLGFRLRFYCREAAYFWEGVAET